MRVRAKQRVRSTLPRKTYRRGPDKTRSTSRIKSHDSYFLPRRHRRTLVSPCPPKCWLCKLTKNITYPSAIVHWCDRSVRKMRNGYTNVYKGVPTDWFSLAERFEWSLMMNHFEQPLVSRRWYQRARREWLDQPIS